MDLFIVKLCDGFSNEEDEHLDSNVCCTAKATSRHHPNLFAKECLATVANVCARHIVYLKMLRDNSSS